MANSPVSVIIPCYRQGRFLAQAIDSVLAQTYRPVEVVVVNDGSDDDTETVAKRYRDQITYLPIANGGPSTARNVGIHAARGDAVLFLDADDLLHPEAISWLVEATGGHPSTIGIFGFSRFLEHPGDDDEQPILPPFATSFFPWMIQGCMAIHCHLCPRHLILEVGCFDSALRVNEDYHLWWCLARRGAKVATVSRVGAYYRRSPNSLSTNWESLVLSRANVTLRQHQELIQEPDLLSRLGSDLLRAIYAVRRRLRAHRHKCPEERALSDAIRDLHARGFRVNEPFPVKLQDRLPEPLGDAVEWLGLTYYRVFRPRFFATIQK